MQVLALLIFLAGGVVLCALAIRAITVRYRLPWREALQYFGLAPYPHERR
jgi:hypothetical protein